MMRAAEAFANVMAPTTCTVPGCDKPIASEPLGLCNGHLMRHLRGKPVNTPLRPYAAYRDTWDRLAAAALAYAEAEGDEAYERARSRLKEAALAYNHRRDLCLYGHPLDGEASSGGGRRTRYCKTCRKMQRDRRRDRKSAQPAGLAPAFEEG